MAYPDESDHWLDENTPLDTSPDRAAICAPVIAMEDMVRSVDAKTLKWYILRGGTFVGPGTFQEDEVAQLRAAQVIVPGDGGNFISAVHVADMATAIVAALQYASPGSIFNIVDEPIRQGDYWDHLANLVNALLLARSSKLPSPPSFRCSNRAAQTVLGWTPTHGIWSAIEVRVPGETTGSSVEGVATKFTNH